MDSEVTWSTISIGLDWGHLAGKWCAAGGGGSKSRLRILGLHGWLDNANTFDTLAPYLPTGTELLVLDFPGHGYSDHLPAGAQYDMLTYVLHLRRAVDKIGWEKFVILGHSMGAGIGTFFTGLFPERVIALVKLDGIIFRPMVVDDIKTNFSLLLQREELRQQKPLILSKEEIIQRLIHARGQDIEEDVAHILLPRSAQEVEGGYKWNHDLRVKARFFAMLSVDGWLQIIARIKCPVLIITAKHGIITPSRYEALKEVIEWFDRHAKWFEIKSVEGSHHVHLSHPERVAEHLIPFLQRVTIAAPPELLKARL